MSYLPFNIKTDYYLLNSLIKVNDLINFCNAYNIKSAAICDSNLGASFEFYNKAITNNIKPCIGLEVIYKDIKLYLYAENYDGFKNLLKINTIRQKKELDILDLTKYSNNVLCIISKPNKDIFDELIVYNNLFISYKSKEEETIALVITNNVIYSPSTKTLSEEDNIYLNYLNELGGSNNLIHDPSIKKLDENKYNQINNVISKLNLVMPSKKLFIPKYDQSKDSYEYLLALSSKGLYKRLNGKITKEYQDRLDNELSVIKDMGFTDYFLIVYDYVLYAKKNNILVGPGKGSAAGSLVSYAIGITDIDPLKYDLLFERFLNKDRITMPDIDIDFDSEKRIDVIKYVQNKYGHDKVAVGLTYNTLKAKLVLKEISKIMKLDNTLIDKFVKSIDRFKSLKENLDNEVVSKYLKNYPELKKLYQVAIKLENIKKNVSTHAAGVVICSDNLDEVIPVEVNDDLNLTGITMDYLDDLGILKMDFLGVKNLSIISNILNIIDKKHLNDIDLNDPKVIKIFTDIKTDGIFQYDTPSMKKLLSKLKPDSFKELIAAVALVRPGPSTSLDDYIKNKQNKNNIKYYHSSLEDILKETYGIILYQEQIIKILVLVGGFSMTDADIIRRAISKKKIVDIKKYEESFVKGAIKNNYEEKLAKFLYAKIVKFANYGFNKSHSVAYAIISYQMAYLKVYHEEYFINSLLNDSKDINAKENYLMELKNNNIKIIKPEVNYSFKHYELKNNQLILPLTMIKGITKEIENTILEARPYEDYFDFMLKNKDLPKDKIELLIYGGALRSFNLNYNTLISNYDVVDNYADLNGYGKKPLIKEYPEFANEFLRNKEFEIYNFYIGNHPSSIYKDDKYFKIKNAQNSLFKNVVCAVIVSNIKKIKTKNNDDMAFLTLSDETGKIEGVVFKDQFNLLSNIKVNDFVFISGKVSKSYDKINIIVNSIKEK